MEASSTADKTLFLFRVNGRLSIRNDKRTTSTAMRQLFVDVKQNWSSAKTETESVSREWETNCLVDDDEKGRLFMANKLVAY